MGAIEGNRPCSDNDWESIAKGGDAAIKKWIADQMDGKSCVVVLIGANTAGRKWINHEIIEGWDAGKGVLGVHVHSLLDNSQQQCSKGRNPFDQIGYGSSGKKLSSIAKVYDPPYSISTSVYRYIKDNLADWVEEAVTIRNKN
jgi:hypothetical protein